MFKKRKASSSCNGYCESFQSVSILRALKRQVKPRLFDTKSFYQHLYRGIYTHGKAKHTRARTLAFRKNASFVALHLRASNLHTRSRSRMKYSEWLSQTDDRSLVCLLCAVHEGCICMQIDPASRNRLIRLRIEIMYAHAPVRLVF